MTNRCLAAIFAIAVFLSMFLTPCVKAKESSSREYLIKAAFLYNFAKFVEWPESAFTNTESPFIICILGKDPFGDALKTIAKKKIRGRILITRRCKGISSVKGCHILFVAKSEKKQVRSIIDNLKGRPVFTVSDMDDFVEAGGMIGMVRVENQIRFHINLGSAQDSGLTISSQLLNLAKRLVK